MSSTLDTASMRNDHTRHYRNFIIAMAGYFGGLFASFWVLRTHGTDLGLWTRTAVAAWVFPALCAPFGTARCWAALRCRA